MHQTFGEPQRLSEKQNEGGRGVKEREAKRKGTLSVCEQLKPESNSEKEESRQTPGTARGRAAVSCGLCSSQEAHEIRAAKSRNAIHIVNTGGTFYTFFSGGYLMEFAPIC